MDRASASVVGPPVFVAIARKATGRDMGSVMTHRFTGTRPLFRVFESLTTTRRRVGMVRRPRRHVVGMAFLLGVALSSLTSPDLQATGSREARAAGLAVEQVSIDDRQYGYDDPTSCDKDQYFQAGITWDALTSYFTGTHGFQQYAVKNGYCMEKPRTTRPGVKGGNRWDYWGDYWERQNQRNHPMWTIDWWGR
jgi:hypothetical protein